MRTEDELKHEIAILKRYLTEDKMLDSTTLSVIQGIVAELEWVLGGDETQSASHLMDWLDLFVKKS